MNQPLDHAGFSIKGFKEIAGHDDSRPFECSIYYKGKRVCKAWDDGWGGGGSFQWLIKNVEKIWNEHIEKLPPWEYGDRKHKYDSDLFLADIIENHEFLTKIRRLCKNHILMRFPEDGFYTYRKISYLMTGFVINPYLRQYPEILRGFSDFLIYEQT